MSKSKKITYWIATIWLSLGMVSTGVVQIMQVKEEADNFSKLGYPAYLMTILGVWKLLGVVAILAPKFPIVKEWAYAGFFFTVSGATISHLAVSDPVSKILPLLLLLVLTAISWYFRPPGRKTISAH